MYDTLYSLAKRTVNTVWDYVNIHVRFHAIIFKEYSRNKYCLNKSNLKMSNIEYLRQLHHKMLNLKRTQFRVKEFYSYEKDLIFRFCIKDLSFIYYVHEKAWTIYNAWY